MKEQLKVGDAVWYRPALHPNEHWLGYVEGFDPKWPNHAILRVSEDQTVLGGPVYIPLSRIVGVFKPAETT
jgi:hypothetical protein